MPRPAWLIHSTRTRAVVSVQSCRRPTARFWRAALSTRSADSRAITSRGLMPRPAWLIRSTRTRTMLSFQSQCRPTGRFWRAAFSTAIGGQKRHLIARLDPTTGLADSFDANANDAVVWSIAVAADGKILVGGDFSSIGGETRGDFARLSNDTAALQNLAVTQTTVTWTRGGSSPQFTRVTFEYSADNVNYTPPGQRHGRRQQLDPDRPKLPDPPELLHPRSRLLS